MQTRLALSRKLFGKDDERAQVLIHSYDDSFICISVVDVHIFTVSEFNLSRADLLPSYVCYGSMAKVLRLCGDP